MNYDAYTCAALHTKFSSLFNRGLSFSFMRCGGAGRCYGERVTLGRAMVRRRDGTFMVRAICGGCLSNSVLVVLVRARRLYA